MTYANLNDAVVNNAFMAAGDIKIWYYKSEFSRDAGMGRKFCNTNGLFQIDVEKLENSHALLGSIKGAGDFSVDSIDRLEEVYWLMQGENWSPNGEANKFIRSLDLSHTSMSVGDVIEFNGRFMCVDNLGFVELKAFTGIDKRFNEQHGKFQEPDITSY